MKYVEIIMNPEKDGIEATLLKAFEANKERLKCFDPQLYYALLDFKDSRKLINLNREIKGI